MSEKKFYVNIDLQSNEVVKLKADTLDITTNLASANTKRIVYWAGDYYYSDGTNWIMMSGTGGGVTNVTATTPISSTGGTTPDISISQADNATNGYLSSTDWNTFNGKQNALGFTPEDVANKKTTMTGNTTSNVFYLTAKAIYDWATGLFVQTTRNLTVNGTTADLSADRTFTVTDANLSTSDITTNDVSTTKHGFAPKLPNDATKYLDGTGNYSTPAGGSTTPNVQTVTSAATVTPTSANDEVVITAQAVALTLANPTGTPSQGQALTIRIKDNGTSRTIAYDTQYRAVGVTLPTNTTVSKTLYLGLIYNSTDTKWDVVGVSLEGSDPFTGNDWVDYSATSTIVGWSSFTTKIIRYRIIGKQLFFSARLDGTSNSTSLTFTLPNNNINVTQTFFVYAANNGINVNSQAYVSAASNVVNALNGYTTWTASGTKTAILQGFIEIA